MPEGRTRTSGLKVQGFWLDWRKYVLTKISPVLEVSALCNSGLSLLDVFRERLVGPVMSAITIANVEQGVDLDDLQGSLSNSYIL